MKNLTLILIFITNLQAQITSYNLNIIDSTIQTDYSRAGSCSSPNGSMMVTTITPPSFVWLNTNGYCHPLAYGTNPTVCWTFIPSSTSVTINSGYSTTGCLSVNFGGFTLYNSSCISIGTGLNFTGLTPGNTYTWCMTGNAFGGFGCIGFTSFCPYFFNNSTLPVELLSFEGINISANNNLIQWSTATEINCEYFDLEYSKEALNWLKIARIEGNNNSNIIQDYSYIHTTSEPTNYYRLKQVDFNGDYEYFGPISINTEISTIKSTIIYDISGKIVTDFNLDRGIYIVYILYTNGNIEIKKIIK